MAKKDSVWSGVGLAAIGAALGAAAAVLTTPKSGKQTRTAIAKEVKKDVQKVKSAAKKTVATAKKKTAAKKK